MRIPKKYGESQVLTCPFCDKRVLCKNKQGIPVCSAHAKQELQEILCSCKSPLELRKGKWGLILIAYAAATKTLSSAMRPKSA